MVVAGGSVTGGPVGPVGSPNGELIAENAVSLREFSEFQPSKILFSISLCKFSMSVSSEIVTGVSSLLSGEATLVWVISLNFNKVFRSSVKFVFLRC